MLSLNISSSFKDIGTIYILIPILLIPQLILGGIIVNYDKMNPLITNRDKVPVIADMIASRWAFEAACVSQFKENKYSKLFYEIDKEISRYNYKYVYWVPVIENNVTDIQRLFASNNDSSHTLGQKKLVIVRNEILKQNKDSNDWKDFDERLLEERNVNNKILDDLKSHILYLEVKMNEKLGVLREQRNLIEDKINDSLGYKYLYDLKNENHNKSLEDLVLKRDASDRIVEGDGELIQLSDPIFNEEYVQKYSMDCRSNFYSPKKYLLGIKFDTFWFNIGVIWAMCGGLFASLHFNLLKKVLSWRIFRK
jgi:hypothetical protein